jgi:flagellar biosynthesis/type III secretory pathway chaperone
MSLENSIKDLTTAIEELTLTIEKSNQDTGVKMASEYILQDEVAPTIKEKPVKQKPIPVFIDAPAPTADVLIEQPAVTMGVLEMRDTIRTMCSELVQSDKKNKVGIEAIFNLYKATHLKMVDDAHIPSLYDSLTVFKGKLK